MIAEVMLFLVVVSAVVGLAARLAEDGLRKVGIPTRWLWLGAMAAPWALLSVPLLSGGGGGAGGTVAGLPVFELAPLTVGGASDGTLPVEPVLAVLWLLASGLLAFVLIRTRRTLAQERASWERLVVSHREVYVSPDRGPAVAGVFRPWIVLPRWSLSLPDSELQLVVLHEEEHLRAGDTLLLGSALALLVASAWSPVSWWQLRRLRTAMEVDCDRRVLRRAPDRGRYGNSLLVVAARASGPSLGLAAFTEKSHSLETRIVAMTPHRSSWAPARAALFVLLAAAVALQACGVDSPVTADGPSASVVSGDEGAASSEDATPEVDLPPPFEGSGGESTAVDLADGPTFTPFTDAPSITNREEVIAAMEANYPPLLREAGIGGTVRVYFFINALGDVEDVRVDQSSGHPALDDGALAVADVYRFSPARLEDKPVPVWVSFPITFRVR